MAAHSLPPTMAALLADTPEGADSCAHHGAPVLTPRDQAICAAMLLWIQTVRASGPVGPIPGWGYGQNWLPSGTDIVKSRLFWRIRSGKAPLPVPPPRAFSCPWYELIDEADRPHWCYELHEMDGHAYVAQCQYEVIERDAEGRPARLKYRTYRFRCWKGPAAHDPRLIGWWLQLEGEEPVSTPIADAFARKAEQAYAQADQPGEVE